MNVKNKEKHDINTTLKILSVALIIVLIVLLGLLAYKKFCMSKHAYVSVPDNMITSDKKQIQDVNDAGSNKSQHDGIAYALPEKTAAPAGNIYSSDECHNISGDNNPDPDDNISESASQNKASIDGSEGYTAEKEKAEIVKIYKNHPDDNSPFNIENMFPGDSEIRYYCVRVSHKDSITVFFNADVRPGYEKLAEVLKCKVELLTTGETLYEGLMRDMPEKIAHILPTADDNELYYKITTYMETSVGNEYQNKELAADFIWWTDDEGGLIPPVTGGSSYVWLGTLAIIAAVCLIISAHFIRKRKKEGHNAA